MGQGTIPNLLLIGNSMKMVVFQLPFYRTKTWNCLLATKMAALCYITLFILISTILLVISTLFFVESPHFKTAGLKLWKVWPKWPEMIIISCMFLEHPKPAIITKYHHFKWNHDISRLPWNVKGPSYSKISLDHMKISRYCFKQRRLLYFEIRYEIREKDQTSNYSSLDSIQENCMQDWSILVCRFPCN